MPGRLCLNCIEPQDKEGMCRFLADLEEAYPGCAEMMIEPPLDGTHARSSDKQHALGTIASQPQEPSMPNWQEQGQLNGGLDASELNPEHRLPHWEVMDMEQAELGLRKAGAESDIDHSYNRQERFDILTPSHSRDVAEDEDEDEEEAMTEGASTVVNSPASTQSSITRMLLEERSFAGSSTSNDSEE